MDQKLVDILNKIDKSKHSITVLTGAGISAESGIPTFRGTEGYWTVGSREYHPQEMATWEMFSINPQEVWKWYLYRRTICNRANPNAGHMALVTLEQIFGERFCLITQNVDGLHLRAGNTPDRIYHIHGNINFMRCSKKCNFDIFAIPDDISPKEKNSEITEAEKKLLVCPKCGGLSRPHILWFDECYEEMFYRSSSAVNRDAHSVLLIVVGTSGATTLPMRIGSSAIRRGATVIDINPQDNPFREMAQRCKGYYYSGNAGEILPSIVEFFQKKA